ncbi:MAG: family 16 glycosylhydrolase [Lachnospiraceae bacterium]|nr:family 16 glycosylhydrolase [Lachnospiraceae bacterium]
MLFRILRKARWSLALSAAFICCLGSAVPVLAEESAADEPEVSISTDKAEYSDGETITETVTVRNTTDNDMTDVAISGSIPEGYVTNDGKTYPERWTSSVESVAAGESTEVVVTFTKKADEGQARPPEVEKPGNNTSNAPKTGDDTPVALIAIIGALSLTAMILLTRKKRKNTIAMLLAVAMTGSLLGVGAITANAANTVEKAISATKDITVGGNKVTLDVDVTYKTETPAMLSYDGYTLMWSDEFDGDTLNRNDWNVELHAPGWVNAELQEYVDSTDNIYLMDGKLVIKPKKTVNPDGTVSYTSGRINTQGKRDFTYGLFEARVKVPEGKGYLPAFWLMASDENLYGQWPRCGEIDIMEVHGSATDKSYGTIHFGNPHKETQNSYTLSDGSFSAGYHTFAVEWEPGMIKWYVDGKLFHTADDWYSVTEGQGEITYPAPFDQPFYMILNLAVGGSWVGYPDDTTDFDNAAYEVDYVRVYQKDSYDENVTKPEREVVLRDPDANGNYVINGDFSVAEDLSDDKDWIFLNAAGGKGTATISNGQMSISTTNPGTEVYGVQLVQPNIPMKKGATYTLTFDAYADEARTMVVDVSAPDRSWIRYMPDTTVNLTTTKQTYTYSFKMTGEDDANARLEFNLGKTASTAGVKLSNVSIKMTDYEEIVESKDKTARADGNYVYNGSFQEGADRREFWDIDNKAGAEISVTPLSDGRRLKIVAPAGTSSSKPVIISQGGLAMVDGADYILSFDVQGEAGKTITAEVAGQTTSVALTGAAQTGNSFKFSPVAGSQKNLKLIISEPGTYYLDNVRIDEDSLIKNGSFSAGLAGYEPYVDGSAAATYVVDSLTEDNAVDFTINDTGDAAWKIQLKQNNIELEKGQWYRLSIDAKSDLARKLMFAIQRDGSSDDNWEPYSGEKIVELGSDYQTYTLEFEMKKDTDLHSVLSISMGAVGGTQITTQHRICIDNIVLEKIDAPEITPPVVGDNMLENPLFDGDSTDGWYAGTWGDGQASVSVDEGKVTFDITNVGTADSQVQLKQSGLTLETGATYEVSFRAKSTEARTIKTAFLDENNNYDWYGGQDIELGQNVEKNVSYTFTVSADKTTCEDITFQVSMGKIDGESTPASAITLSDFSVKKVGESSATGDNMFKNPSFDGDSMGAWSDGSWGGTKTVSISEGKIIFDITDVGTEDSHISLKQSGLTLETGATYEVSFMVNSTEARTIRTAFLDVNNGYDWYGGQDTELEQNVEKKVSYTFTVGADKATCEDITFQVSMGKIDDPTPASTITLSDFSITKVQ